MRGRRGEGLGFDSPSFFAVSFGAEVRFKYTKSSSEQRSALSSVRYMPDRGIYDSVVLRRGLLGVEGVRVLNPATGKRCNLAQQAGLSLLTEGSNLFDRWRRTMGTSGWTKLGRGVRKAHVGAPFSCQIFLYLKIKLTEFDRVGQTKVVQTM